MRTLSLHLSLLSYLDELEFTEAALSFDADASHLAPVFKDACTDWAPMFKNQRTCRRDVLRAEALVAVCNRRLDRLTMRFAASVRAFEPKIVDELFGNMSPSDFVRQGLRKQCEKTRDVTIGAIKDLGPNHPLYPFSAELGTHVSNALDALDARTKAKGARTLNANQIGHWKQSINALRTKTYGELLKIAADQQYTKQWADTFFLQQSENEEEDTEGEEPATP